MATSTHVTLNNGKQMPIVGLGTWKSAAGLVRSAVIAALEAGIRHIDCAAAYGNEGEVGEGLRKFHVDTVNKMADDVACSGYVDAAKALYAHAVEIAKGAQGAQTGLPILGANRISFGLRS